MKLAVIGVGNMGGAIATAVIQAELVLPKNLLLIEPDQEKRENLGNQLSCATSNQFDDLSENFDFILLAIKPQISREVLTNLRDHLHSHQLLLSILAGTSIDSLQRLSDHTKVVRIMPNTPAQLAQGMSVFHAAKEVNSTEKALVKQLLDSCGKCFEVQSEIMIDAATAISGSGPAYLFYLGEQMVIEAMKLGFSESEASQLVQQTIFGSAQLWLNSGESPGTLRQRVTSPGGTTAAAIEKFNDLKIGSGIQQGIHQAFLRAVELSKP
ncbi:MAG: pyrroline-5-carboxylate reductase [bacterium]